LTNELKVIKQNQEIKLQTIRDHQEYQEIKRKADKVEENDKYYQDHLKKADCRETANFGSGDKKLRKKSKKPISRSRNHGIYEASYTPKTYRFKSKLSKVYLV